MKTHVVWCCAVMKRAYDNGLYEFFSKGRTAKIADVTLHLAFCPFCGRVIEATEENGWVEKELKGENEI